MAQAEHQQGVVAFAAIAHQLALCKNGDHFALNRAFEGDVLQFFHTKIERGIPCGAKLLRAFLTAKGINTFQRHIDDGCRARDASGVGQRFDKAALSFRCPAVMPVTQRNWRKIGQRRTVFAGYGNFVTHRLAPLYKKEQNMNHMGYCRKMVFCTAHGVPGTGAR